jgi:sarcosine oxidase, subunit beta
MKTRRRDVDWRSPDPKPRYDVVIVGGGGHGLATAYNLAREHGLRNVAVLEEGRLGDGTTGHNASIVHAHGVRDRSAVLCAHALKLWERLSRELNYNVLFSRRGVLHLAHTLSDVRAGRRRVEALRLRGIDASWLGTPEIERLCRGLGDVHDSVLNTSSTLRYPVLGAAYEPRGGIASDDAVVWAYARAARARGVDVIQNCRVTGIHRVNGSVAGVDTTRGAIGAHKVALASVGRNSVLADMAGLRLPLENRAVNTVISEPIKPVLTPVVVSSHMHVSVSQALEGELVIGGGSDADTSDGGRGGFDIIEDRVAAVVELFPFFERLRMMRQLTGVAELSRDGSPIISKTPVKGLYLNGGWGADGLDATPGSGWLYAWTIAKDEPHPINAPFSLQRFATGALIDERGAAMVAR